MNTAETEVDWPLVPCMGQAPSNPGSYTLHFPPCNSIASFIRTLSSTFNFRSQYTASVLCVWPETNQCITWGKYSSAASSLKRVQVRCMNSVKNYPESINGGIKVLTFQLWCSSYADTQTHRTAFICRTYKYTHKFTKTEACTCTDTDIPHERAYAIQVMHT